MKKIFSAGVCAAFAAGMTALPAHAQPASNPQSCAPAAGLSFVCGADRPEDLALIPETRWLIATGFTEGAGLKLVDTQAKTMRFWYTGEAKQIHPDKKTYRACPSAPDPKLFNVQGINLREQGNGRYTLLATNHGGREAIEVFTVEPRGKREPTLTWTGCVLMPQGLAANSVASFSDGTLLATVLVHPGKTYADYTNGKITGGVYEWKPGTAGFRLLPGTELPGNNGLETSRDDREFYVVAFGLHAVLAYSRADTTKPVRMGVAPGFMPDNIHWYGDQLIAAGMTYDEPACGGKRKVIDGKADPMNCHRGYIAAWLDPLTMAFSMLSYAEPNPDFNGVSTAVIVGNDLWLGSWQSDRMAWRTLPAGVVPAIEKPAPAASTTTPGTP